MQAVQPDCGRFNHIMPATATTFAWPNLTRTAAEVSHNGCDQTGAVVAAIGSRAFIHRFNRQPAKLANAPPPEFCAKPGPPLSGAGDPPPLKEGRGGARDAQGPEGPTGLNVAGHRGVSPSAIASPAQSAPDALWPNHRPLEPAGWFGVDIDTPRKFASFPKDTAYYTW